MSPSANGFNQTLATDFVSPIERVSINSTSAKLIDVKNKPEISYINASNSLIPREHVWHLFFNFWSTKWVLSFSATILPWLFIVSFWQLPEVLANY